MQQTQSVASACDDEECCGQKCQHDDDANGQEGHIGRQGLSNASRPRSFLVREHIGSQLSIAQARKAGSGSSTLLLRCLAAGCCEAEQAKAKQSDSGWLRHGSRAAATRG